MFGPYIARVETDITGAVHLHVIFDDQVTHLSEDPEKNRFVTLETKVDLEDYRGDKNSD